MLDCLENVDGGEVGAEGDRGEKGVCFVWLTLGGVWAGGSTVPAC